MKKLLWLALLLPTLAFADADEETFAGCALDPTNDDCVHVNEADARFGVIEAHNITQDVRIGNLEDSDAAQDLRLDALEAGGDEPVFKRILPANEYGEIVGDYIWRPTVIYQGQDLSGDIYFAKIIDGVGWMFQEWRGRLMAQNNYYSGRDCTGTMYAPEAAYQIEGGHIVDQIVHVEGTVDLNRHQYIPDLSVPPATYAYESRAIRQSNSSVILCQNNGLSGQTITGHPTKLVDTRLAVGGVKAVLQ